MSETESQLHPLIQLKCLSNYHLITQSFPLHPLYKHDRRIKKYLQLEVKECYDFMQRRFTV
jgi:hypothetical protein